MNPVCSLIQSSRSILRFGWSVPFLAFVKPTGLLLCTQTETPFLANESSLQAQTIYQIYNSLSKICSLTRLCETQSFTTVLTEPITVSCKWIQSIGPHYLPDLYFAAEVLFPSSPLWIPQFHYCAQRLNHRPLQMNPVCRLTLYSKSKLRCGWPGHFLAPVKATGSLLCTQTQTPVLEMNAVCRLTLFSRSIFHFGWSVHFIASVKPIGSLLCSETQPTAFAN
jgi:hypothetical protein